MKMDIKEILKKISEQIKNTKVLAVIFIVGIGLILFPSGGKREEKVSSEKTLTGAEYKAELESELKSILSQIKGAGKVSVMITLSDEGNTYFAVDESVNYTDDEGKKNQSTETGHVLRSEDSNTEEPLITRRTYPEISGVLVCADGAFDPQVKNNIIKAVEALLGVRSHRVEVLERK